MHAAVVTSFDKPPAYREFPSPTPQTDDEVVVDVIASGLHPRVRSQADGSHYTSSGASTLGPGHRRGGTRARRHPALLRSCPTPPWARWPNRPSSTDAAASLSGRRRSHPGGRGDESRYVLVGRPSPAHRLRARPIGVDSWRHRQLGSDGRAGRQAPWRRPCHRRRARRCAARGPSRARRRHHHSTRRCHCDKRSRPVGTRRRRRHRLPLGSDHGRGDGRYRQQPLRSRKPLTWIEIGSVAGPFGRDSLRGTACGTTADRRKRTGLGPERATSWPNCPPSPPKSAVALSNRRPRRAARRRRSRMERHGREQRIVITPSGR